MTPFQWFLAGSLLIVGTYDTLIAKAVDLEWATDSHGNYVKFNHPFFQVTVMFMAEFLCFCLYYLLQCRRVYCSPKTAASGGGGGRGAIASPLLSDVDGGGSSSSTTADGTILKASGSSETTSKKDEGGGGLSLCTKLLFIIPGACDLTATTMMNIGLVLTSASMYAMLRGSVIVFTSLLAFLFLKRKPTRRQWLGVVAVALGTAIVGTSSLACVEGGSGGGSSSCGASSSGSATVSGGAMIGNILILVAQIFTAGQCVLEEAFLARYPVPPLLVVGMEGVFGFSAMSILVCVLYYVATPAFTLPACLTVGGAGSAGSSIPMPSVYAEHWENAYDAFFVMGTNVAIPLMFLSYMISLACFNFLSVTVTKEMGATTRAVMNTLRTTLIWICSLALAWETFCYVQIIGFAVLILGQLIFIGVIPLPCLAAFLGEEVTNRQKFSGGGEGGGALSPFAATFSFAAVARETSNELVSSPSSSGFSATAAIERSRSKGGDADSL